MSENGFVIIKCEDCGENVERPKEYEEYNKSSPNIFFRWCLKYCDPCRRKREMDALKNLSNIMNVLAQESNS